MNELDWFIVAVCIVSGLFSLFRGFVKELLSMVIWIVAIVIAIKFSPILGHLMASWIENESIQLAAAFLILLSSTLVVGGLVNQLLAKLINYAGLGAFDRILGMLLGMVRGMFVVVVLVIIGRTFFQIESLEIWQTSTLAPYLADVEESLVAFFGDFNAWRVQLLDQALS